MRMNGMRPQRVRLELHSSSAAGRNGANENECDGPARSATRVALVAGRRGKGRTRMNGKGPQGVRVELHSSPAGGGDGVNENE